MTELERSARKITFTLFLAQSLFTSGLLAANTVNPIIAANMGGKSWAGLPIAVQLLGSALAASAWGVLMDKIGRRNGIALGLILGVLGAGLVVSATNQNLFPLMLAGMAFLGFAQSAIMLGRFAAAEVNPPEKRGAAIANMTMGGIFGAIFGPRLVGPMGSIALSLGMDELAGGYLAASVLLVIASLVVFIGLRPEPRDVGKKVAALHPDSAPGREARPIAFILRQPAALTALITMAMGQAVVTTVMVITALYMKDNNHSLSGIATVISAHTLGVFGFSVVAGRLADKWGRGPVILTGAATMAFSCIIAPLSTDILPMSISLFLLGLGWIFCFVGSSSLLADQLSPAERSRTQGVNDLLAGLAAATGSLGSGLLYAATSYTVITLVGGTLALIPLGMVLSWMRREKMLVGA